MIKHCGFIAVTGRPNVGKSTLLNRIAGNKVSIVSHRAQTTRSVIRLISDYGDSQIIWLDTPGWQQRRGGNLNRLLNSSAEQAALAADAILFITVAKAWTAADTDWLAHLPNDKPIICAINKIDRIADKDELLAEIAFIAEQRDFAAIIPISGKRGQGLTPLKKEIVKLLPAHGALFDQESARRRDVEFFFSELMREKIFTHLGDEVPYQTGVTAALTPPDKDGGIVKVECRIYVEKTSQKGIIIGQGGQMLKKLASSARHDMQRYYRQKIFLSCRVYSSDWQNRSDLIKQMKIGESEGQ